MYRSPSVSVQLFVQHLSTLLEYINTVNIAVGDYNDSVLCENGSQVKQFMGIHS